MVLAKVARLELKGELRLILLQHQNRGRAITGKELARMFGYRDDRQIRLAIRELIRDGLPIAAATESRENGRMRLPAGYFLATTWEEANEYADSIKGRLIEDALRRRDFRRGAVLYLKKAEQWRLL
jgi:hypothetical protein